MAYLRKHSKDDEKYEPLPQSLESRFAIPERFNHGHGDWNAIPPPYHDFSTQTHRCPSQVWPSNLYRQDGPRRLSNKPVH